MVDGGKVLQLILQIALVTGGLNLESSMVNGTTVGDSSSYNFFANHRPRFKIPKGNLSYYRRPQWEINYFMRYGTFPFYATTSPFLNRTEFWNKMRAIKNHLDRDSTGMEESGEAAQLYNNENQASPIFVPISGEDSKGPHYGNMFYPGAVLSPTFMDDNLKSLKRTNPKKNGKKVPIDIIGLGPGVTQENGRPPVVFLDGDNEPIQDPNGVAAEMTIERKVGRKFQTQGWK